MADKDTCTYCNKPIVAGIGGDGNRVAVPIDPARGIEDEANRQYVHWDCHELTR